MTLSSMSFPDLGGRSRDARFTPTSGHRRRDRLRPKSARSRRDHLSTDYPLKRVRLLCGMRHRHSGLYL
jgi:hypothetical protein